jgi:gamma-glutamylcyclotransferase (GGCT)/AIG2-like uncharacterized protein YtfP
MTNIFTYGSLMSEDIMTLVAGCAAPSEPATLHNFRRVKIRNEEYPAIFPQNGNTVSGVLYYNLSAKALERLDHFEGEYYTRETITVQTASDGPCQAMAYVFKPAYYQLLTDEQWHFAEFLATGKARFMQHYFGFTKID